MNETRIGIIGQGFVGTAIREKFKKFYEIIAYDISSSLSGHYHDGGMKWDAPVLMFDVMGLTDVTFVCLPTPMEPDGRCHTDIVEGVIVKMDEFAKTHKQACRIVVIKSTVPPGTTREFNEKYKNIKVVFNPEFLTEANAIEDFANIKRVILGGPRPATSKLKTVYSKVFPGASIIKTDSTYAEMVKYLTNVFLATKVSFANEMYQICEALDIDYDKVTEYATFDERLGKSHWGVPGPDGQFGWSGSCFPKDLAALIHLSKELGIDVNMLEATWNKNLKVREEKDWEQMEGRAVIKTKSD